MVNQQRCARENPGVSFIEQTSNSREITKVAAEALQYRALRAPRRNMKPSMKDKIKGSFHEVKGTIKEEVGKVTNDRNLKAKGKAEKRRARFSSESAVRKTLSQSSRES
jgi:uncharacterized protein YjbJ (UPF0337 family)